MLDKVEREVLAILLLILIGLAATPSVGILGLLTVLLGLLLLLFRPYLKERAKELFLLSRMREVALLFSANLIAVKSFERAVEKTLEKIREGEIKNALKEYLIKGQWKGSWSSFFSFVKEHVKSGKRESVDRALSFYLKGVEEHFQKALENTVNPIKMFLALAILLPIMIMVAVPIFSLFFQEGLERPLAYFFAFLLPLSYLLFILYIYYTKPKLGAKQIRGSVWPILGLVVGAFLSYFVKPILIPITVVLPTLIGVVVGREEVERERPWFSLHPIMSQLAIYLGEGYSMEYALAKLRKDPFKPLPPLLEVIRESAERSVKEGAQVAEKLAKMLEREEEMEQAFREKLDEVISTLSIVVGFVLPLVGGATLAFTLALFEYISITGEGGLFPLAPSVNLHPIIWSFTLYVVESLLIIALLKGLLEGKEGLVFKEALGGLLVFPVAFGVLYFFIKSLMGV